MSNSIVIDNCYDGDVRLSEGNVMGKVEVCINSVWYTICDHYWTVNEANVVCKQLGYSQGRYISYSSLVFIYMIMFFTLYICAATVLHTSISSNYSVTPIGIYRMQCTGYEDTIWNCEYSLENNNNCLNENGAAAMVQCTG